MSGEDGISVIVPFAPGETEGAELLTQLCRFATGAEIVLVRTDDDEPLPASAAPGGPSLRECRSPPGRARQMNAGAGVARGRWLWFLHADSRLHARTLPALRAFLERDDAALGFFDLRYRHDGPALARLNALGANLRSRRLGLPFGDQGFVLPAVWFARLGGYDESLPFGEDHALVWRAHTAGLPVRRVGAPLSSSARKYGEQGWGRTTRRHLWLTIRQAWPHWQARRERARRERNSESLAP